MLREGEEYYFKEMYIKYQWYRKETSRKTLRHFFAVNVCSLTKNKKIKVLFKSICRLVKHN